MRTGKGKEIRKGISILLAGAMLALTACGGGAASAAESAASETESAAQAAAEPAATAAPTAEPTPAPAATWLKEPFFEAEYLDAIAHSRPITLEWEGEDADYNSTRNLETSDGYMEFSNQPVGDYGSRDKGVLDAEGNVLAEDKYSMVSCGYGGKYALTSYGGGSTYTSYTIDADGKLQPLTAEEEVSITGTSTNPELCWIADEGAFHVWGAGDTYIQAETVTVKNPVAATYLATMPADQMIPYDPDKPNEYVLTDGTKPITEDRYEAADAYSSGVFAVKKDGKWGYADATGTLVIPCEYDASWTTETDYSAESCYAATENTVVLCKNGEYALYGADNTEIIPFGEYEALRPVYNGTLWAKQDGKWGLLQLSN